MDKPTEEVEVSRRYFERRREGSTAIEALRAAKRSIVNDVTRRLIGVDERQLPDFDECYGATRRFVMGGREKVSWPRRMTTTAGATARSEPAAST